MFRRIFKVYFILIFLFLTIGLVFPQIHWIETSQSDFADGKIDQSLYVSHRAYIEGVSGAVEWTPRYDFDLNGFSDLVSSDYNYGVRDIRVWYMNASGLDSSKYLTFYDAGGANDVADLNCDGYPELVQSGFGWNNVLIFWNNLGAFSDSDTSMLGPHSTGEGIYIADYDKDGYLDIAITGEDDFRIYWGDSGGTHGWQSLTDTVFDLMYGTHFNIESADIDNDGDLDIMAVYGRTTNGPLYIFRSQGARIFALDSLFLSSGSDRRHGLSVGDIDNDGDIDIVSTGFWTSSATIANVLLNDGTGHFTTDIPIHPGPCHGGSSIYDFNGDGWLDILFFRGSPGGYLKIYENIGAPPYFTDASSHSVAPFPVDASGGMVIDVNNDGYVDIYMDNMGDNSYLFWGPDYLSYVSLPVNQDHHGMFRDPGNILNKTKTAFYESSIFDAGESICSGTVSWVAYDERDYFGGTLPIPIGSQVIILGRSGDTPSPDASWTDWDTLADDSPLPTTILGHRYFQYRAELWYSNPAYLPWLEQIEFNLFQCVEDTAIIIQPLPNTWTSCEDQTIIMHLRTMTELCSGEFLTDSGEVPEVLILGYFYGTGNPLDDAGLSGMNPSEGDSTLDKIWFRFETDTFTAHYIGHLPFRGVPMYDIDSSWFGIDKLAYIHFYLCSPNERDICMNWWVDDDLIIYLDGEEIYTDHSASAGYGSLCSIHLTPGPHSFLFWVCNSGGAADWNIKWRFEDEFGSAITDLYYAVDSAEIFTTTSCPFDPTSIDFTVNGIHYAVGDGYLTLTDDSILIWTPIFPDTFEDGDTVHVCLLSAEDTCGGTIDCLPICWDFYVDLTNPTISDFSILPGAITTDTLPTIEFCLFDSLSGLDTSSINMSVNGIAVYPTVEWNGYCWDVNWIPTEPFLPGESIEVCIQATDTTDYCDDNAIDSCWMFFIESSVGIIDSVWFYEETDCNDSNIVEICYILSGDTSNISIQISPDSGATWVDFGEDWFITFEDTAGDIGDSILPGIHCFEWLMSLDIPGTEGISWMIEVTASNLGSFTDSFTFLDTSRYRISGNDGFVNSDSGYFVLTTNTSSRNGRLLRRDSIYVDTLYISYDFKINPGYCPDVDDTTGGDGLSLIFSRLSDPPLAIGGLLGIMYIDGWGVAVDIFQNICCDIDGNHLEVSTSDTCCFEGASPLPTPLDVIPISFEIVDGNWHHMELDIELPTVSVSLDGVTYISDAFPSLTPFWAYIGFVASTGGCYAEHIVDNFTVCNSRDIIIVSSDTAIAPLDSRPPDVSLSCLDDIVSPGDTIHLHWTIDDLFWSDDECTLYIDYCGLEDTILTSDTLDDWIVPDISCDSICFRIAVRDSFCNWGYDECCVPCLTGLFANLITPPNDSVIACDDQEIVFEIFIVDSAETSRILWIADTIDDPDPHSPFGYDYDDLGIVLVDSLSNLGFVVDTMSPSRSFEDTLSYYNLLVLAYNIPNPLSSEQIDSIDSFVSRGGGLLSLPQARLSDEHEVPIHNAVLSLVGISYMTPRIDYIDSIPIYSSHPIFDGVESITFYKPFPINCAPSQCLITYSGYCIMAADTYNSGKIVAKANDHFLNNGDLIYTGVSGPVRTDYRGADNYIFARNLFMWLAGRTTTTICPIDTSSIILTIDGIDYTIDSLEIDYTEPYLTFTPPSTDYWTSGVHTFSLHIEDTCGNTFDSSYSAIFDFDPPDIDIVNHILVNELDSVEIILTDTIAGLNPDTGYYVIDSEDTIYYSLSDTAGTLYICPDTGWSAGEHSICITACDAPDLCAPNCDDTCFTIIYPAILSAEIITPPNDSIIACNDQQIIFHIYTTSALIESTMVLLIGDNHGYYDYFSHDSNDMGNFLIDTLESMDIYVSSVSPLTDVSTLLNNYDIVFLLYDIWDSFTSEEIDSFESFIRRGGSFLSIPGAPAGDYHEAAIHNDILSLIGISYITPRLSDIDSIGVSGSHPVLDGVNSITFYKPFPIDCSDEQCIVHYGSNCIMAVDTYYSGKILAYANEHFLVNGDRYYGSIRTGNVAADNCRLGKNIFRWLSESMETTCPLDTSSIILTIDGIDYTIDSLEIDYTEPYLTFTPPSTDYWTSGVHTFSLYIEDTCGNTFDSSYSAIFDFDPPDIDIVNHILVNELDSVEIILTDTIAGLNPDTGYYVIDSEDTIYYSLSDAAGTLYICPDTGWSAGEHSICITVCDDPDLCAPNCDDTCFTIIYTAILSAEIITPPNDSIIACDDQPIIFHIHYDSLCMPLDTDSTMLIIDSVDTYTLDSTELYFDPAESLLQFQPGSGYWHSGWHFFQLHLRDDCGNTFDSIYSAIFDVEPPNAYMFDPPVGEPMDTSDIENYEPYYIYDTEHTISIRLQDTIAGVLPESTTLIVRGQIVPFRIFT